jgi:hypothetical protein
MIMWSTTNATSCTASGGWSGTKTTAGMYTTPPLSSDTTYSLACVGAGGSSAASATVSVSATTPPPSSCLDKPYAPTNLRVTSKSSSSISLAWDSSEVANGCVIQNYQVYRGGTLIATVSGTTFKDTKLRSNTSYTYYIVATDSAGHSSDQSSSLTVKTRRRWF